ncbi:hypothetical protein EZ428_14290 [Pedobacter frigiditerrae]|uniref:Uncharacterized protein n=1 Tax=Pedobacter frigiditerrae TaxID=2530452 RepID=A0A4R0MTR7_9SPHI|nr:hypothetical protein [Pedobacter frigiditerrae]TCC90440.1 hypothetical protein EZ428_14290 [Pedobacter frigiditerrae]
MKTDFVEIFQTIRANLHPYTANGFTARINSETVYELWSEKLFDTNGEKIEVVPFASVAIENEAVKFCIFSLAEEANKILHPDLLSFSIDNGSCFSITKIDDNLLAQIINALGLNFTNFKQKGWV